MSQKRDVVLRTLAEQNIPYQLWEHPAVYTIEEMDALDLPAPEAVVKNLFLRDAKGRRYFLVVLSKEKQADLRALGERLGVKLSFASSERLAACMGLEKGSVTPFGVLNDQERKVEVLLDQDLRTRPLVAVHPNENTATVALAPEDLLQVLEDHGNSVTWLEL
ncbi:MAG TPA: prolyl-tRNA synthetase associated domain-containing protein [Candidatus Intestinimonas pullistercoris]|uniref:Prolyl-tRNA synthetase associated domain-containing protein n=1 Tax=Candidatus Intestinimonas pullistercoris TaxID=2838623 RepID=A0A9D2T0F7_9FIRM|nr:prolyl-tRNA synthetase associated domain-containing protein [Candidatus Intestinimonas pullistercoris]